MDDVEVKRRVQGCYTEIKEKLNLNQKRVLQINAIIGRWFEDILR